MAIFQPARALCSRKTFSVAEISTLFLSVMIIVKTYKEILLLFFNEKTEMIIPTKNALHYENHVD